MAASHFSLVNFKPAVTKLSFLVPRVVQVLGLCHSVEHLYFSCVLATPVFDFCQLVGFVYTNMLFKSFSL